MRTIGTVRYNLRIDKTLKDGLAPIELIYSVSQQRKYYNTAIKIYPCYWDSKLQKAVYIPVREAKRLLPQLSTTQLLSETEVNEINNSLMGITSEIDNIEQTFRIGKVVFSSQTVIETLKANKGQITKKQEPAGLLFNYIDIYISEHQHTREPGSLTVYNSVKNHLKAYQESTGHKVTFDTIDYNFFHKFQSFLINRKKVDGSGMGSPMLNNTTIAKALSTLKTFLGYARREGIKVNDGYKDFTIKKEKLEVIALDQDEFNAILDLDLSFNKRLDKARDIFVFSCTTGLRYSDYAQLKHEHISNDIITLTVKKTKSELTIPLNSISAAILKKYKEQIKPIPLVSNQNLNYSIKDLCELAGIIKPVEIVRFSGKSRIVTVHPKHELIHFHTGRKTFVTLSLEKGMSAEEVMEISGHSDYRSFKRYVRVTEKRKKSVMLKAWGNVSNLKIVS